MFLFSRRAGDRFVGGQKLPQGPSDEQTQCWYNPLFMEHTPTEKWNYENICVRGPASVVYVAR